MTRYRKKPVEVEAFRLQIGAQMPEWFWTALNHMTVEPLPGESGGIYGWGVDGCVIHTPEGMMTANLGDWIIRGVKGEIYPCKPDVFAETYEAAE